MDVTVQFTAKLPIKLTKRKNWVVASCPILDVHSQGETEKKAKKNLEESLTLFFISCFERGTLDAVLKECGFKAVHKTSLLPPSPHSSQRDFIRVPIPFLVSHASNTECHA